MELASSDFGSLECKAFAYLRAVPTFSRDQTALNAGVWWPGACSHDNQNESISEFQTV